MPSINHDGPIELIRQHPDLAVELAQTMTGVPLPEKVSATLGSTDASNVVPDEFRADMVVMLSDVATGEPNRIVIIEPQGRESETKKFAWPSYITNLRSAHKCPSTLLLIICWDETEAIKCRKPIQTGHPGFDLAPIVISPGNFPSLTERTPWLTVLAGTIGVIDLETDHGCHQVLDAITATEASTPDIRTLSAIILGVASDAARQKLEAIMRTTPYSTDFWDRAEAEGMEKGIEKGIERGIERGIEEGAMRTERQHIAKVLDSRGIQLSDEHRDLLGSCTDLGQLQTWFSRALTASSAAEVFGD